VKIMECLEVKKSDRILCHKSQTSGWCCLDKQQLCDDWLFEWAGGREDDSAARLQIMLRDFLTHRANGN
jgi:hypothetical protein